MQLQEIITDQSLRELTPRGTPAFPLEMYCNNISDFVTHYVPWHWHKEIEFGYVLKGGMTIESSSHKEILSAGDGFFINSNQLHAMRPAQGSPCETVNIVFDPEVIAGAPHSVYESKYVLPLTTNSAISVITFFSHVDWQSVVLTALKKAFRTYTQAGYGYELRLRSELSLIWLSLFEKTGHIATANHKQKSVSIKNMLTYLHQNYMQSLSLEDIARSGNVGPRTCCRCFHKQIGMTPFEYLMEYRIKIAAELLSATDKSVTEICFDTGFRDASYFAKTFKNLTGYTPSQFRKTK